MSGFQGFSFNGRDAMGESGTAFVNVRNGSEEEFKNRPNMLNKTESAHHIYPGDLCFTRRSELHQARRNYQRDVLKEHNRGIPVFVNFDGMWSTPAQRDAVLKEVVFIGVARTTPKDQGMPGRLGRSFVIHTQGTKTIYYGGIPTTTVGDKLKFHLADKCEPNDPKGDSRVLAVLTPYNALRDAPSALKYHRDINNIMAGGASVGAMTQQKRNQMSRDAGPAIAITDNLLMFMLLGYVEITNMVRGAGREMALADAVSAAQIAGIANAKNQSIAQKTNKKRLIDLLYGAKYNAGKKMSREDDAAGVLALAAVPANPHTTQETIALQLAKRAASAPEMFFSTVSSEVDSSRDQIVCKTLKTTVHGADVDIQMLTHK